MLNYSPPVGFHFLVVFEGLPGSVPIDVSFQEVSGLTMDLQSDTVKEGGENRFSHRLPTRADYGNLTLKRGLMIKSPLTEWIKDAIQHYDIRPLTVHVSLLNPTHIPISIWTFQMAWPVKWDVSGFNSTDSSVVTETLELSYQFFEKKL